MNETVVNETVNQVTGNATIGDALVHISDKLGIGVQEIYRIYVEAQGWLAFKGMVSVSVFIVIFLIGTILCCWMYSKERDDFWLMFVLVSFVIALIIAIGVDIILGYYGRAVIPEYYALQDLLGMLSQAV